MSSQNVEVIDLTNETITLDDTITNEEILVGSEVSSDVVSEAASDIDLDTDDEVTSIVLPNTNTNSEARRCKTPEISTVDKNLQKQANKANAACHALDNCTAKLDESILKLINDPEETLLRTLFDESMVRYQLVSYPKIKSSISWTYKRLEVVDGSCVTQYKDSTWMIVIIAGDDYLKKLVAYRESPNRQESLKTFLNETKERSGANIILLVYNLANHLKSERMKEARNYRKRFDERFGSSNESETGGTNNENSTASSIGVTELQDLRLMLELESKHENPDLKLHIEFYEKTDQICQAIVKYTLSIARLDAKDRLKTTTGFDWALNMDKERAYDPTRSKEDLTKLWITQLQQFAQVTLPIAKAIAAEYPSPCALIDQYKSLSRDEAEDLLAEISVQRNLRRQIGSNISKRIYCFLTCEDPDVHIVH